MRDRHVHGNVTVGPQKQILDFEAMIRDIDEASNADPDFLNIKVHNPDPSLAMIGKDLDIGNNIGITEDLGPHPQNLKKVEDNLSSRICRMSPMEVKFEMVLVDNSMERKESKVGPKRRNGKGKYNLKPYIGPVKGNEEINEVNKKSPKGGCWTRLYTGPKNQDGMECIKLESDPKRKCYDIKTDLSPWVRKRSKVWMRRLEA